MKAILSGVNWYCVVVSICFSLIAGEADHSFFVQVCIGHLCLLPWVLFCLSIFIHLEEFFGFPLLISLWPAVYSGDCCSVSMHVLISSFVPLWSELISGFSLFDFCFLIVEICVIAYNMVYPRNVQCTPEYKNVYSEVLWWTVR